MEGSKLMQPGIERDFGVIISNNGKPIEQCLAAAKMQPTCWEWLSGITNQEVRTKVILNWLYKTLARPRLEYCVQVWCSCLRKDVEVLEQEAKLLLG